MPDYTTDERWRRGPRKHTARRWYNTAKGGLVLRCDGCDYEPVEGTAREQEDAHRAHRVAMGENVKAERTPPVRERLKQAEGAIARVRAHCELLADASCRVAARETAQDVLRLLDGATGTLPADPHQACEALYDQHVRAVVTREIPEDAMRALGDTGAGEHRAPMHADTRTPLDQPIIDQ